MGTNLNAWLNDTSCDEATVISQCVRICRANAHAYSNQILSLSLSLSLYQAYTCCYPFLHSLSLLWARVGRENQIAVEALPSRAHSHGTISTMECGLLTGSVFNVRIDCLSRIPYTWIGSGVHWTIYRAERRVSG